MTATSTASLAATSKSSPSCYVPAATQNYSSPVATLGCYVPVATSQAATPTTKIDEPPMSSAALLKLNADTWLILDGDWPSQVHLLSKFVPFPVEVVLISPNSTAPAKRVVIEMAHHAVKPCANGWFQSEFNTALSIFGGVVSGNPVITPVLPLGLQTGTPICVENPKPSECGQIELAQAVEIPSLTDEPLETEPTAMATEEVADDVYDGIYDELTIDPELWEFVTQGVGRVVDKASIIRAAITAKLVSSGRESCYLKQEKRWFEMQKAGTCGS